MVRFFFLFLLAFVVSGWGLAVVVILMHNYHVIMIVVLLIPLVRLMVFAHLNL